MDAVVEKEATEALNRTRGFEHALPRNERQTAQINVRISADLKARGEEGLAAAGITPSEAIRMLYEFAANSGRRPGAIRHALSCEDAKAEAELEAEREKRRREFWEDRKVLTDMWHKYGWDKPCPVLDEVSYEDLKAEAYAEKYGISRG